VLAARGWDVERKGLAGSPRIRILANADRHGSVDRAIRLLGMGLDAIEPLAVDDAGGVTPEALAVALEASEDPAIVVLQAGELNAGTFDPFDRLAPVAQAAGAWVHVDGAFGLWARVSDRRRDLGRGLELCDSWTADGHKYLNLPYDSGFAFVRDAAAHRAAMTLAASYLPPADGARDALDWNPEFSRRARAVPVYAAVRELGREGLADLVERTCRHAAALTARIGGLEGAEVVVSPVLNQGLVRFIAPEVGASDGDHDRRTEAVIGAVNRTGVAMFGGVTWRGRRAMRISVCNWRTTDDDVERTVAAVAGVLASGPPTR
jgi:aromatic-L-amino-acid decarboxylase